MKHRIVTAAQMKEIERAGNAHGLPYLQMMEKPPTPSCGRAFRWAGRCSSSAARATTAETAL